MRLQGAGIGRGYPGSVRSRERWRAREAGQENAKDEVGSPGRQFLLGQAHEQAIHTLPYIVVSLALAGGELLTCIARMSAAARDGRRDACYSHG